MDKGREDSQKMPGLTASVCQNGSVALSGAACPGRSSTPALTLPRISSMTTARAFRGFRFPAEVILWAVRWYLQFPITNPVLKYVTLAGFRCLRRHGDQTRFSHAGPGDAGGVAPCCGGDGQSGQDAG